MGWVRSGHTEWTHRQLWGARIDDAVCCVEPAAGVEGLPPPRSAAIEQMHRQHPAPGRVKVFMPQQYNSPMGMYSAHNVLETFTAQAESMLDTLEQ